ncbi:MAG TPA: ATP-binding protein [Solirubrobacteraceae bacterium]
MAELPNVLLDVGNRAENVLLVREMLTGVAEAIELDGSDLNDILTAVTEACNNVVLHAYEGEEGPLEVEVELASHALEVVVRDYGIGIQTQSTPSGPSLGIGLTVIQALVHRVELRDRPDGGTEVRMEFAVANTDALESLRRDGVRSPTCARAGPADATTTVTIAPIDLARTVLPRVLSTLAARAHFSTDRISDTLLVADALVVHAPESLGTDHLRIAVSVQPRNLELHIGPLGEGRAEQLVGDSNLDGLGRVIEKLADRQSVAGAGPNETLTLALTDRR